MFTDRIHVCGKHNSRGNFLKTLIKSNHVGGLSIAASAIPTGAPVYIRMCSVRGDLWVEHSAHFSVLKTSVLSLTSS